MSAEKKFGGIDTDFHVGETEPALLQEIDDKIQRREDGPLRSLRPGLKTRVLLTAMRATEYFAPPASSSGRPDGAKS